MSGPFDENDFRDCALEGALAQLAELLIEFQGLTGHGMRFDILQTHRLRVKLAALLAEFIEETPIEAIDPKLEELLRPTRHSITGRLVYIAAERNRLEKAGLIRRRPTAAPLEHKEPIHPHTGSD